MAAEAPIGRVTARTFAIPTDLPESDGTLAWDHTTIVLVNVEAGGATGLGYSYCGAAAAELVSGVLAKALASCDAFAIEVASKAMADAVRNIGRPGISACAISAVDIALWDLKARLLDTSLMRLLGAARESVPAYGSGGFTSYSGAQLSRQLAGWVEQGCAAVKMKVGRVPSDDLARVDAARDAIGAAQLFIDANGAYSRKEALRLAGPFAKAGVSWFEEPVSSDDLEGLRLLRDRLPPEIEVAAGEYGYTPYYFRRMLEAGAVDVLQADATRCGGITGFLRAAALADAFQLPLSSHCAPAAHLSVACASPRLRHMEWFHDHVRIEQRLFDGAPALVKGQIAPDLGRQGNGLALKESDAKKFEI